MSRPAAAPCWDRGVPARTEFCADPDGFQTTWLRGCASRHQRRPNFRAESRSCCLRHARRDRTSPHLLADTPSLESGRPGRGPRHACSAPQWRTASITTHPSAWRAGLWQLIRPLRQSIGSAHETTAEYRGHAARRLGRRLSERLARHDHGKPDRGGAVRPALGGDPGRSPLP